MVDYLLNPGLARQALLARRRGRPRSSPATTKMAAGVLQAARRRLRSPSMAVVGFDDARSLGRLAAAFTTIRIPTREVGRITGRETDRHGGLPAIAGDLSGGSQMFERAAEVVRAAPWHGGHDTRT